MARPATSTPPTICLPTTHRHSRSSRPIRCKVTGAAAAFNDDIEHPADTRRGSYAEEIMTIELVIVSTTPGLAEALQGYEGLQVSSLPSLARARSIVSSDQPPQALYIEDTKGTLQEVWDVVRAAQGKHVPVLLGLHGAGLMQKSDF